MPTDKPAVQARVTQNELAALEEAMSFAGDRRYSEAVRAGLYMYCETHGIEWPGDMPAHGGVRVQPNKREVK